MTKPATRASAAATVGEGTTCRSAGKTPGKGTPRTGAPGAGTAPCAGDRTHRPPGSGKGLGQRLASSARQLWRLLPKAVPTNRQIALAFGGVTLLTSLLVASTVPQWLTDRMLSEDLTRESASWAHGLLSGLENDSHVLEGRPLTEADVMRLRHLGMASEYDSVALVDAEGRIVWSSREKEIGTAVRGPDERLFEMAKHGQAAVLLTNRSSDAVPTGQAAADPAPDVAETWITRIWTPVIDNGGVIGAIGFMVDVTQTRATILHRMRLLSASILGSANLLILLSLWWFLRQTRARAQEAAVRAEKDAEAMARQVQLSREVQLLGDLNEWLQSADTMSELFGMVSRFMTHILPFAEGSIYVYSNSRDVLDGWASWNGGDLHDHIRPDACWGLRRGRTYTYGASEVNFACDHAEPHDGRPYFCFPILAHGETVGLMHIRAAHGEPLSEFRKCQRLAQMCAEQISMAIANVQMRDQLREQSIRDPLTGLFNRRHMTDMLRRFLEKTRRGGDPVSILSLDVDHFKKFNDNHGHDAGDMVLRAVGEVLQNFVSGDEIACRPGGEEFAVILPGINPADALARAEALRAAIEARKVHYGQGDLPRITISVGVAHAPQHGMLVQELLKVADEALYEAKARGRNCVVEASNGVSGAGSGAGSDTGTNHAHSQAQPVTTGVASPVSAPDSAPVSPPVSTKAPGEGSEVDQTLTAALNPATYPTATGKAPPPAE